MISNVRFFVAIGLLVYFYIIVRMIHHKKMSVNHSLPWMVIGIIMLIFDIFPSTLTWISHIIGIQIPLNAFLIVSVMFIFLELICFSAGMSEINNRLVILTQSNALLEKRIRELERALENGNI